jgi:hypothetical protein
MNFVLGGGRGGAIPTTTDDVLTQCEENGQKFPLVGLGFRVSNERGSFH